MPRIPEGKFRLDPSSRVGSTSNVKIDAGPIERARQLGKGFTKIADQLRNAKRTAEALNSADKVDEEYNNTVLPALEQFRNSSVNGMVKDPTTGKEVAYSEAVNKLIKEQNERVIASLGTDSEAMSYFARYTQPKMEAELEKARRFENVQMVSHRKKQINNQTSVLTQRYVDKLDVDLDVQAHADKIVNSAPVIGQEAADEALVTLYKNLAYQAPSIVRANGVNPDIEKHAKRYFSFLGEAERRQVEREFAVAKDEVERSQVTKLAQDVDSKTKDEISLSSFVAQTDENKRLGSSLLNNPVSEKHDSISNRVDQIGKVFGRELSMLAIASNRGSASLPEYLASADQFYDQNINRLIAGSVVGGDKALQEEVKKKVINNAILDFSVFTHKRDKVKGGAFAMYADINPEFMAAISSGNKEKRGNAIRNLNKYYDDIGLSQELRVLISPDAAEAYGKRWKQLGQGLADTTGERQFLAMEEFMTQYGEYTPMAIDDAISLGKGTASGEPNIPPVVSFLSRASMVEGGKGFATEVFANKAVFKNNLKLIKGEDGKFSRGITGESDFRKKVASAMNDSEFNNLYFGSNNENVMMFRGMQDAVLFKAAHIAAQNEDMDVDLAVDQALQEVRGHFRMGASNDSSVIVNKDFIKKYNPTETDLDNMTDDIVKLQYFDQMNIDIDFQSMASVAQGNSWLSGQMAVLKQMEGLGKEKQREQMLDTFGKNIVAYNDPTNNNVVRLFLKPDDGGKAIPLLRKSGTRIVNGNEVPVTKHIRIDLENYYKQSQAANKQRQEEIEATRQALSAKGFGKRI